MSEDKKLLTVDDLSNLLKISKKSIYKNYKNWQIPYIKMGKIIRFNETSLKMWLNSKTKNGD